MEGSSQRRALWLWVAAAAIVGVAWGLGGPYFGIQYASLAGMAFWAWRLLQGRRGALPQPDHVRMAVGWLAVAGVLVDCFIVRPSLDARVFGFLVVGALAAWWGWKFLVQDGGVAPVSQLIREGGGGLFGSSGDPRVNAARRVTRVITRRRVLPDGDVMVTIEDQVSATVRNVRMSQLASLGGRLGEGQVLSETDERLLALSEPAHEEIAPAPRKSGAEQWYRDMFDDPDRPLDD